MTSAVSVRGLRFAVAGPGRVGSSLAHWLVAKGGHLVLASSPRLESAGGLVARLGGTAADLATLSTAGCDLLLVTVPDPRLPELALDLARRPQARVVLHASGSHTAAALAPLASAGSAVGSLHPLMAFPAVRPDVRDAESLVFGCDGDPEALALCQAIAAAWRARAVTIPPESRLLYHFGATLAAGGVLTLTALAEELGRRLGLPAELGRGYRHLAATALAAAEPHGSAAALTGPVARGDRALVAAELERAEHLLPESAAVARTIALETLRQIESRGGLTEPQRDLRDSLSRPLRG